MRTTTLITAAALALTAYTGPALARSAPETVSLSACGGDKDGDQTKRKKRKGDGNSFAERSACGGEDGDTNKRKKRKGDGNS